MAHLRHSTHSRRPRKKLLGEINIVPYIDVMLVLLTIFMITAPLLQQGVNVNLPQTASKPLLTRQLSPLIISIDQSGHYYLNVAAQPYRPLTTDHLIKAVKTQLAAAQKTGKNRAVYVQGDKAVAYGKVVAMMALLQQAGINKVGLITEQPTQTK